MFYNGCQEKDFNYYLDKILYYSLQTLLIGIIICLVAILVLRLVGCETIPRTQEYESQVFYNVETECDEYQLKDIRLVICQDWDSDSLPAELIYNPKDDTWELDIK